MKGDVEKLAKNLSRYTLAWNNNVSQALTPFEPIYIKINTDQIEDRQKDNKDQNLPEYSSQNKALKGVAYYNLHDTGSFLNKFKMSISAPKYSITSTDKKLPKLLTKVGERMFGIPISQQTKAQKISNYAIGKDIKSKCFKNK